jgi:hypothetical protein
MSLARLMSKGDQVGQVLGAAFKAQLHDTFGSFKGAIPPYPGYSKVPDCVTMNLQAETDEEPLTISVWSLIHQQWQHDN